MDELFVILDITGHDGWPSALPQQAGIGTPPRLIPLQGRSTALQVTRAAAEQEALRLARHYPARRFALFHATHMTVRSEVPTFVNFKGEPVQYRHLVQLLPLDDGVPF